MSKKLDIVQAMGMNRHERRRLGKINKTKIPGVRRPFNKEEYMKQHFRNETNTIQKDIHTLKENIIIEKELVSEALKENNDKQERANS